MAGVKRGRGRGRGNLGARLNSLPLPFRRPATQASSGEFQQPLSGKIELSSTKY